jgi:hypothetical protein
MLTREQNTLLTETGPGTPGGALLRRYWQPVALAEELPPGAAPLRVRIPARTWCRCATTRTASGCIAPPTRYHSAPRVVTSELVSSTEEWCTNWRRYATSQDGTVHARD